MSQGLGERTRSFTERWRCPGKGAGRDTKERTRRVEESQPKQSKLFPEAAVGREAMREEGMEAVKVVSEVSGQLCGREKGLGKLWGEGLKLVTSLRTSPGVRKTFCQGNEGL